MPTRKPRIYDGDIAALAIKVTDDIRPTLDMLAAYSAALQALRQKKVDAPDAD